MWNRYQILSVDRTLRVNLSLFNLKTRAAATRRVRNKRCQSASSSRRNTQNQITTNVCALPKNNQPTSPRLGVCHLPPFPSSSKNSRFRAKTVHIVNAGVSVSRGVAQMTKHNLLSDIGSCPIFHYFLSCRYHKIFLSKHHKTTLPRRSKDSFLRTRHKRPLTNYSRFLSRAFPRSRIGIIALILRGCLVRAKLFLFPFFAQ